MVNFVEKTALGFGYFIPTTFITSITENILSNKLDYWMIKSTSFATGMLAGAFTGSFLETQFGPTLDSFSGKIDWGVGAARAILFTISASLFGKTAQAATIEEDYYPGTFDFLVNYHATEIVNPHELVNSTALILPEMGTL
jgi:hypothetical protein